MESLMEVSEKVSDVDSAVKYFASNYGEKLTNTLKVFSNECWKRAALIIGYASAGRVSVPRHEDLPESLRGNVAKSLGNALNRCGVDDYLLVGNVIPPLIRYLTYTRVSTEAFIDKYNEAVAEVNRILNIARGRGISDAEKFYALGLASIIANAARLGRDVRPSDADIALHIASFAIPHVASPGLIKLMLDALEPLYGEAPLRYLELLTVASDMKDLDLITVLYIFDKLNEILDDYGDVVKEHAWSLVYAINAYADLLGKHIGHFNNEEVRDMVGRVVDLLNELGRFKSKLRVIAWAHALAPALMHENVRRLMEEKLGIDVVGKAGEVLKELNDMRKRVQELIRDEEFMSYIESRFVKADEEAVKIEILEAVVFLGHVLALHRLDNDELDEAKYLINEITEKHKETGDYENYLVDRNWALRVEAIKGSLVGDRLTKLLNLPLGLSKLVNGFRELYEETFNMEHFKPTATYLSTASSILGNYLVSLALTGDHETINKLLEEHSWVLNAVRRVSVLTRLMLNALLGPGDRLSSELKGKLNVNPEELINAFEYDKLRKYLPAVRVALGMISPEDGYEECRSIKDSTERRDCEDAVSAVIEEHSWVLNAVRRVSVLTRLMLNALLGPGDRLSSELKGKLNVNPEELINAFEYDIDSKYLPALMVAFGMVKPEDGIKLCEEVDDKVCIDLVLAVKGDSAVVKQLIEAVINAFNNSLKGFGSDVESLINELRGLVYGLDNKSLVQLLAINSSMSLLALMLHALINGNKELAKAHALLGAIYSHSKLLGRLYLEVYKECCDLKNESFRLALARLFFLHV
jgi:hypothetical protein